MFGSCPRGHLLGGKRWRRVCKTTGGVRGVKGSEGSEGLVGRLAIEVEGQGGVRKAL